MTALRTAGMTRTQRLELRLGLAEAVERDREPRLRGIIRHRVLDFWRTRKRRNAVVVKSPSVVSIANSYSTSWPWTGRKNLAARERLYLPAAM